MHFGTETKWQCINRHVLDISMYFQFGKQGFIEILQEFHRKQWDYPLGFTTFLDIFILRVEPEYSS